MTFEEARRILRSATQDDSGTFVQLRLGNDPGNEQISRLRLALRVLWRKLKDGDAVPYEIATATASIMHFADEARRNLLESATLTRQPRLDTDLTDLAQDAYNLLAGPDADLPSDH